VIIEEKIEEETHNLSNNYVIVQLVPTHWEPLTSSSNQPPFLERLVMEKYDTTPDYNLASKLRNLWIKVPLLQAIKEIPICTKIVKDLCLKNPRRKRVEPRTIQFFGRATELMTWCVQMEKYIDLGNSIVFVQIGDFLVPNVLIDLGATINVMTRQTMEQLWLTQICATPILL